MMKVNKMLGAINLVQWCSNFNKHVETVSWISTSEIQFSRMGWAHESAFLSSSWVRLMLLFCAFSFYNESLKSK